MPLGPARRPPRAAGSYQLAGLLFQQGTHVERDYEAAVGWFGRGVEAVAPLSLPLTPSVWA